MPSAIFMGRKPGGAVALQYLVRRGWEIPGVITLPTEADWLPRPGVVDVARSLGLPLYGYRDVLASLQSGEGLAREWEDVEWVFSYLFPYRVRPPLLGLATSGALNFHPAPLPEYGGLGGYNFAILEGRTEYGVTCHFMDECFDTGDIVRVCRFPMDPSAETVASLETRSQMALLQLFADIVREVEVRGRLSRMPQKGRTRYIDRAEFEAAKIIRAGDDAEAVRRRVRAFWYPPYEGAKFIVGEQYLTVVSADLLRDLGPQLHAHTYDALRDYSDSVVCGED